MEKRKKRRDTSRQAILVALLISLLLHQLFLTGVGSLFDFGEPEPEKRHEVVLRTESPPEEPEPPATPEPEPKKKPPPDPVPPKRPVRQHHAAPAPAPTPTPAPREAVETGPAAPDDAPAPEEAMAAGPEPTPDTPPSPPKLDLSWKSFERLYGATAKEEREAYAEAALERRRGRGAFSNYSARVMKAVRSNKSFIKAGQQEVLGAARQRLFHNYIEAIHQASIHPLFADSFLASLPALSADDPLNDWSLHMVAEFEIFETGQISEIRVVRSSGNMIFDAGAVDSIYRSSPFPRPPKAVLSWNGRVYLRWGFYRNHRKCGVFNVEPYILKAPGASEEALPVDAFNVDG